MIQNTHFTGLLTHTLSIYAQIYSLHPILRTFEQSEEYKLSYPCLKGSQTLTSWSPTALLHLQLYT